MLEAFKKYLSKYVEVDSREFSILEPLLELRNYDKKVKLIDIGEEEKYLNFVVKGLARKYFYKGREEIITQIAKEGDLISSSVSFLSGTPSTYVVDTIEPTVFVSLSKAAVDELYSIDPKWQRAGRLIITDLLIQKEYWELDRMKYTTKERFIRFLTSNGDLFQRVPQKYLASYLNIQPETFSRLKHFLRKRFAENNM
ncbi:MAG: Crp/Fnr family transcriptional regulator [Chitinophagaceae bacterium]|nr:Crp/Fnr family transcriptional regulator [Chitinophagaceae bacterium]